MNIGSDLILVDASSQVADLEGEIALCEIAGSVIGTVFTFRDVTVRNSQEEHRRQDFGTRACARLAGAVSTELRTILRASVADSERLLPTGAGLPLAVAGAGVSTRSISLMADQLDEVERRDASYPCTLNLNTLILDACDEVRQDIPCNIELISHLQPDLYPGYGDPILMKKAIVSLVRHALDSMPTGGKIDIVTSNYVFEHLGRNGRTEHYVRLTVNNRPTVSQMTPGMVAKSANRVFEPAPTAGPSADQWDLRLFNVHGAISDAGGSIQAKAMPSHGMSYEILLRRSDDTESASPTAAPLEPQMDKATILLLHADHAVRNLVLEGLDHAGYEAIGARDSGEALEWMDLYPGSIALLVTDVELCDTSGPALAAQMAVRNPGIRVVFTADHAVDPSVKKAWTEHGARFLEKPFRLEEPSHRNC